MQQRNFKIVDSFLFSEPFEAELLLLKFILEDSGVDEWILLENSYSFQGNYTGLHAQKILDLDERFKPYRHKITVISREEKTPEIPKHQKLDDQSFKIEFWQRDLANDYFLEHYDMQDWIMVSDVDEMIDFTNEERVSELYHKMAEATNGLLKVPTKRYWYDFDNEYKEIIGNAICNKQYLVSNNKKLHNIRIENRRVLKEGWKNIVEFEYSSCFAPEQMLAKLYSFGHTGHTPNDLKQSLRCNHRPAMEIAGTKPENNKRFFFDTVQLGENNSPAYVREHLAFYKTNAIDKSYKQNRRKDYPELFTTLYYIKRFFKPLNNVLAKNIKRVKKRLLKK